MSSKQLLALARTKLAFCWVWQRNYTILSTASFHSLPFSIFCPFWMICHPAFLYSCAGLRGYCKRVDVDLRISSIMYAWHGPTFSDLDPVRIFAATTEMKALGNILYYYEYQAFFASPAHVCEVWSNRNCGTFRRCAECAQPFLFWCAWFASVLPKEDPRSDPLMPSRRCPFLENA